ncbi:MAG: hypothetical protein IKN38_02980 [Clostridia bacterium]|nr:hypothetical protein [Clostridia bacterium]
MMDDLYLWGTAILVGLVSLKLIPAKRLAAANRRMRSRFSGMALAIMYIMIGILFFVGVYFLCMALDAPAVVRNVILGVILGLFIGFIPIVDKKNSGDDDKNE